jgi:hypothetical protein
VVQQLLEEGVLVYFNKSGIIQFEISFEKLNSALYWVS